MHLVLDASMTAGLFFDEIQPDLVEYVAHVLAGETSAIAPGIWWFEIRNVMLKGIRRNRTSEDRARRFLIALASAGVKIHEPSNDFDVFDLALKHRLSFYDACYLELAIKERCPLATLDAALAQAAQAEGVRVITAP